MRGGAVWGSGHSLLGQCRASTARFRSERAARRNGWPAREARTCTALRAGVRDTRSRRRRQPPTPPTSPLTQGWPLNRGGVQARRERAPSARFTTRLTRRDPYLATHPSGPPVRFSDGIAGAESRVERSGIGAADATAGSALYSGLAIPTLARKRAVRHPSHSPGSQQPPHRHPTPAD